MSVLEYRFESQDHDGRVSIREYFHSLLETLWIEGEEFDGKRPFGNSGWKFEIYYALIDGGFIVGKLGDGYVEEVDEIAADEYVQKKIIRPLMAKQSRKKLSRTRHTRYNHP